MGLQFWRFAAIIFLFHGFCFAEKAPSYTFVKDATSAPLISYYDYIIVGGGTSGCPLAATLSQNATVLLLEKGGSPYENPNITDTGNFATTLLDPSPTSPSQQFISEDGVYNARARVLGGGSVINAGFYTRASLRYVREVGWTESLVNSSYEWVEKKVAHKPPMLQWQSAVRDGLLEAGVLPYNGFTFDHIYGTKVSGTIFDEDGHRHSAADLLEYADPEKLTVYLRAVVQRIKFTETGRAKPTAHCVTFYDHVGARHRACLNNGGKNEIILSAGAIGSPQLLMLSGVGPANELLKRGIRVVVDQPNVGQGMSDNPMNALFVPSARPVEVSLIQVVGITRFDSYIETASGLSLAPSWAQGLTRDYTSFLNKTDIPSLVTPETVAEAVETVNSYLNGTIRAGVILEKIMGPRSTGHLRLRTLDADDNPSVTFNYFQEPEDLVRCVQGMRTIIDVLNSRALSKFRYPDVSVQELIDLMVNIPTNLRPRHVVGASISLEQFCRDTVMTIWHYHGGCQVDRVVDRDYKVLGVDGLRVIDGSTFYNSPGTNPQATCMMLGRYMGLRILHDRDRISF